MKQPAYLPSLDGLRGVAALMVVGFHLRAIGMLGNGHVVNLAWIGQTGVDLFFVLSGFLITRILLASRDEPGHLSRFYIRRSLRIFPLYFLGLFLYTRVLPLFMDEATVPISSGWWYWVYLQGVPLTFSGIAGLGPNHFWSLAVEEHFYLVWPWVVAFLPVRRLPWIAILAIFGSLTCRWLFIHTFSLGTFYATPCRLDGLAFGALLASFEYDDVSRPAIRFIRRSFPVISLVLGLALFFAWKHLSGNGSPNVGVFKFMWISAFYASIMGWIVFAENDHAPIRNLRRVLANPIAGAIGRISYGIYVYHIACIYLVLKYLPQTDLKVLPVAAVLLSTLALSWASYRWFERPILGLRPPR